MRFMTAIYTEKQLYFRVKWGSQSQSRRVRMVQIPITHQGPISKSLSVCCSKLIRSLGRRGEPKNLDRTWSSGSEKSLNFLCAGGKARRLSSSSNYVNCSTNLNTTQVTICLFSRLLKLTFSLRVQLAIQAIKNNQPTSVIYCGYLVVNRQRSTLSEIADVKSQLLYSRQCSCIYMVITA